MQRPFRAHKVLLLLLFANLAVKCASSEFGNPAMSSLFQRYPLTFWGVGVLLAAGLLAIYLPGLQNGLVFDDARLLDGTVFGQYGRWDVWMQRWLSFGTFVWLDAALPSNLPIQRAFNLLIHALVCASLFIVTLRLAQQVRWPEEVATQPEFTTRLRMAVLFGVLVFALNPVAVYAVAYLIQRSILMATLFTLLMLWAGLRAIQTGRLLFWGLAILAYILAMLSKEHALFAPLLLAGLYIVSTHASFARAWPFLAGATVLVAMAAFGLITVYGDLVGQAFDEDSRRYLMELENLNPSIHGQAWILSIFNQMHLFIHYGFLWFAPYVGWLSIDLRPAFPVSLFSFPHILGALVYLALWVGSGILLFSARSWMRFMGLCFLIPLVLFTTEFATVWIQDPFVLYRSYLWAIALPGLITLLVVGMGPRPLFFMALITGLILGAMAFNRVQSFRTDLAAWEDAIAKIDIAASPQAVGRWRAFMNRGAILLKSGAANLAYGDFVQAEALGGRPAEMAFRQGVALKIQKKYPEALEKLNLAAARGFSEPFLPYHQGEVLMQLGHPKDAFRLLGEAITRLPDPALVLAARSFRASLAGPLGEYETGVADFKALLEANPNAIAEWVGLGMVHLAQQDCPAAIHAFDRALSIDAHPMAYYGRARCLANEGFFEPAREAIHQAARLDSRHPLIRQTLMEIENRFSGTPQTPISPNPLGLSPQR
jgi:protein O-mannosyl-transferase